jgi:hypothetical protein
VGMEQPLNMIGKGKSKGLGDKPASVPVRPQISRGYPVLNPRLRGEKHAPNRLSYGTASGCMSNLNSLLVVKWLRRRGKNILDKQRDCTDHV